MHGRRDDKHQPASMITPPNTYTHIYLLQSKVSSVNSTCGVKIRTHILGNGCEVLQNIFLGVLNLSLHMEVYNVEGDA